MKKIVFIILIVLIVAVGYYAISPFFDNKTIDDELPDNIINDQDDDNNDDGVDSLMPSGKEELSEEMKDEFEKEMKKAEEDKELEMDEQMPEETKMIQSHPVMGTVGHPASGEVKILDTTTGKVIRYENFETINGPNLHVYLAKDLKAREYYDLGEIKGTSGNINYSVPKEANLEDYKYVMYWCVPFKVLFNYAEIN
ncbi:hypothetical protein GF382_03365 [Candidatus Falkowbacteria bacterium]|nr:hypothetical protein [Candidatus Falkowbacteria bacterium]